MHLCDVGAWDCGLGAVSNHCPCDLGFLKSKYCLVQSVLCMPHPTHRHNTTNSHPYPYFILKLSLKAHKLMFDPILVDA